MNQVSVVCWLSLLASDFIWACSKKTPQTGKNPTIHSIHPWIVNREDRRKSWPLGKMAGVCKRPNNDPLSQMDPSNEPHRTFIFLRLAHRLCLQFYVSLLIVGVPFFSHGFVHLKLYPDVLVSRCVCAQLCVRATIHACASLNVLILVRLSQLPVVTNRLCVRCRKAPPQDRFTIRSFVTTCWAQAREGQSPQDIRLCVNFSYLK